MGPVANDVFDPFEGVEAVSVMGEEAFMMSEGEGGVGVRAMIFALIIAKSCFSSSNSPVLFVIVVVILK